MTTAADNNTNTATNLDDFDIDAALGALVDQEADAEVESDIPAVLPVQPQRHARPRGASLTLVPSEGNVTVPIARERPLSFLVGDATELAEALADDLRENSPVPVVHDEGSFWRYDTALGTYAAISEDEAQRIVGRYSRKPVGDGKYPRLLALSRRAILDAVQVCANSLRVAAPNFFKSAVPGVAFRNGFLALTSDGLDFRSHSPDHRARHALRFDYDSSAPCPRWQQFLREVFPPVVAEDAQDAPPVDDGADRAALLQEFLGVCLFGMATRYGMALVLVGEGANGKSVLVKVATAPFPEGTVTSIAPQRWSTNHYLADLAGKLLNAVSEMPARDIADSDLFKAVVTGDALTADRKYEAAFRFVPQAGHLFACNTLPATRDHSQGFWRRFAVVRFNANFTGRADVGLADRLITEELPGIMAWMVEGARRVFEKGCYTVPPSSVQAKKDWQADADQAREFLAECVVRGDADPGWHKDDVPPKGISASDLYSMYRTWAETSGHKALCSKEFGKRAKAVLQHGRCSSARYYWATVTPAGAPFWPPQCGSAPMAPTAATRPSSTVADNV